MAKYQILKDFPDTKLLRGQIVENPNWRNLDLLVKQNKVRKIEDEPVIEKTGKAKKKGVKNGTD